MEVMMFRTLTLAAAIFLGSVVVSAPVFAAEQGDEVGDGFNRTEADPGTGFAASYEMASHQLAQHRDGYDGDRYWHDGECFPTAPGGCE
jgi:hypothetical protein